jgi:hypothetical protein
MPKTVEAIVGEDGSIQLPDSISLKRDWRVLVTILEETDEANQDFGGGTPARERPRF